MKSILRTIALVALIASARATSFPCEGALGALGSAKKAAVTYLHELKTTKGGRLILKNAVSSTTEDKPPLFRPLARLSYHLVTSPILKLTDHYLGRPMKLSLPVQVIVDLGLLMLVDGAANAGASVIRGLRKSASIEHSALTWDYELEFDMRCADIKALRDQSIIDAASARKYCSNRFQIVDESWYLSQPVMHPIREMSKHGVRTFPGYSYPSDFSSRLTSKQIAALIQVKLNLFTVFRTLPCLVDDSPNCRRFSSVPAFGALISRLSADPFVRYLLSLRREGKLTDAQTLSRLREDAEWRSRFEEWRILDVKKLKKVGGKYLQIPLALKDIQSETKVELMAARR